MQVVNICNRCLNEIEPGKEKYLQLVDKNKLTHYADEDGVVVVPTVRWEYCLCTNCFNEFNDEMNYPFMENQDA